MPKYPRTASDRLSRLGEKQINAWVPVDLVSALDEKLAKTWLKNPTQPRPSRQQFVVQIGDCLG